MIKEIMWEEYIDEELGIFNAGYEVIRHGNYGEIYQNYGYNDMSKGDLVSCNNEEYTIVMVSRMGDFGLSKTGSLPYSIRVAPNKCTKLPDRN